MNEVITFIVDYWQYISIGLLFIFELILLIVKKRPMSLDAFQNAWNEAIKKIPSYIYGAEKSDELSGEGKKECVVQRTLQYISGELGRELTDKEISRVEGSISAFIEAILYCPTKKGGLGREQVEQKSK